LKVPADAVMESQLSGTYFAGASVRGRRGQSAAMPLRGRPLTRCCAQHSFGHEDSKTQ